MGQVAEGEDCAFRVDYPVQNRTLHDGEQKPRSVDIRGIKICFAYVTLLKLCFKEPRTPEDRPSQVAQPEFGVGEVAPFKPRIPQICGFHYELSRPVLQLQQNPPCLILHNHKASLASSNDHPLYRAGGTRNYPPIRFPRRAVEPALPRN